MPTDNLEQKKQRARELGVPEHIIQQKVQQVQNQQSPLSKIGTTLRDLLPTGLSLVGGIAGLPAAGWGALPMAGLGGFTGETLRQMLSGEQISPEKARQAGFAGITGEATGLGAAKLGGKLVSPILKKVKLGTPKMISESIEELQKQIGTQMEGLLSPIQGKIIDIKPIVNNLFNLRQQYSKIDDWAAVKNVEKVIAYLKRFPEGKFNQQQLRQIPQNLTPEVAAGKGSKFGEDIFSEAGTLLKQKGSQGVATIRAKALAGKELKEQVAEKVPGYKELSDKFAELSRLGYEMANPFGGYWKGTAATGVLSPLLYPSLSFGGLGALNLGLTSAIMPYTRFLLRKLIGKGAELSQTPLQYGITNLLMPQKEQQYAR